MKQTNRLAAGLSAIASIFLFASCEDKHAHVPHDHDGDGVADHGPGEHNAPVPHDHDGDGVADHGPGGHNAPVPHDHDGDGIPDHGPGAHHDHGADVHAKKIAGPNGGKIITAVEPHAEFYVTPENKVRITFLNEQNTAVAVADQTVEVVCGDRNNPTMLNFVKDTDGNSLISDGTLPAGNKFPVILTFKTSADAAPIRGKFALDLSNCPSCDHQEYACTCDHGHAH